MSFRLLVLLLFVAAPAALQTGCAGEGSPGEGQPREAAAGEVAVENLRLLRETDGDRAVQGVVVNASDEERSVQVVIALYDAANQRIGEVQVPVERVAPRAEQGFSRTLDRDAAGASVRRILVF